MAELTPEQIAELKRLLETTRGHSCDSWTIGFCSDCRKAYAALRNAAPALIAAAKRAEAAERELEARARQDAERREEVRQLVAPTIMAGSPWNILIAKLRTNVEYWKRDYARVQELEAALNKEAR